MIKSLKDLLTRRLLGEPTPARFTSVDGRLLIGVDTIRIYADAVELTVGDTPVLRIEAEADLRINLSRGGFVQAHIPGLFKEIELQ